MTRARGGALRWLAAAILAFALGFAANAGSHAAGSALEKLKARYARPETIPFPVESPYSPAKASLGARLFVEAGLSRAGTLSCAGCHARALGFEDGRKLGVGADGKTLTRHTPTLWNMAWGKTFFWDGRAPSLEAQARMPIESHAEMDQPMAALVAKFASDPGYQKAFAAAFPEHPEVTEANLLKAIATYERTLVPKPTRFDRWIAGDEDALTMPEKRGFLLFNGKARCAVCHSGFNFTDQAFLDIGLSDAGDLGRGPVIGVPEANHAFKTPTLIDIADRAPYMHDGSLPDLAAVIDHYVDGIVERQTLSPDLKPVSLEVEEKAELIAFLKTLDAEEPIAPEEVARRAGPPEEPEQENAVATQQVIQQDTAFAPANIRIEAGAELTILNRDSRTHTADVSDPKLNFGSGASKPGETVTIRFPEPGDYTVICSIHPAMRLHVEAE